MTALTRPSATLSGDDTYSSPDPLKVLSNEFHKIFYDAGASNMAQRSEGAKLNAEYTQDSILFNATDKPCLLEILSDIASQVCKIDSGAGARLIDSILSALPVDTANAVSAIPEVAHQLSVPAAELLPLVIPAIATALGQSVVASQVSDTYSTDKLMANVIWGGGIFIAEVIGTKEYLENLELHGPLNQVAGLMCAAAEYLSLPLCTVSSELSGKIYRIVVPCNGVSSGLEPATSPSQTDEEYKIITAEWSAQSMPSAATYGLPSLLRSQSLSQYASFDRSRPSSENSETAANVPAYGPTKTESESTAMPPAYGMFK